MATNTTDTDLLDRVESTDRIESTDAARDAVDATMETLGERITDGQADDLAESLPDVAAEPLRSARPGEAEELSLAAFVERVDERADELDDADDLLQPVEYARAAVTGVRQTANDTELERTRDQLPAEFDLVFEPGESTTDDEFLDLVTDELETQGLEIDPRVATDATLETLGDRITGGEAGDLAMYLPPDVRTPLTATDEAASQFDSDEFLGRIATRTDVETDNATAITRAVFGAVRETVARTELENALAQLPSGYDHLLENRS